jgi:hypothetical protein
MSKIIIYFRNFANEPKNLIYNSQRTSAVYIREIHFLFYENSRSLQNESYGSQKYTVCELQGVLLLQKVLYTVTNGL